MPGIVLSVMVNPFKRLHRYEYVYGPASYEALDPIAPLLDDTVYDNLGLVVLGDQYSVWPETGIFPKVSEYREVLEKLRNYVRRKCGIRLSPRLCRRVDYVIAPWSQLVGGWRFTAAPGDAEAFIAHSLVTIIARSKRIDRITVVLDSEADTGLSHVALTAARHIAALAGTDLVITAAEPRPYPPSEGASINIVELGAEEPLSVLRLLSAKTMKEAIRKPLLEPRTPLGARKYRYPEGEEIKLTLVSAAALAKNYITLLAYQACGAKNPVAKLEQLLGNAIEHYVAATQLVKKQVGGNVVHHLVFNPAKLRAIILGVAAENLALREIMKHQNCEEIYDRGVSTETIRGLEEKLGATDATPQGYVAEENGYRRITRIRELRRQVLSP